MFVVVVVVVLAVIVVVVVIIVIVVVAAVAVVIPKTNSGVWVYQTLEGTFVLKLTIADWK